jgi:hypothetical protein
VENQQVYPVIIGRIGNVGKEEVTWVTFVIITLVSVEVLIH